MDSPIEAMDFRLQQLKAAIEHIGARRWRMAEVQCRILLAVSPGDIEGILVLGLAIAASGEATRAAPVLDRVRRARPDTNPCREFATMEPRSPRTLVTRQYRACLRLAPGDTVLRHDFASYLLENSLPDTAFAVLQEAPASAATSNLRGMALAAMGKFKEAARCFETACRLDPDGAGGWSNLGMMLRIESRFDESLAAYDRAIERNGEDAQIRVNRAIALLHAGFWAEGWPDYDWRFNLPGHRAVSNRPALPSIDADTRLDGQRVLIWHEEGFGDTLQFARYLPLLVKAGAHVTVYVPAPLVRLLGGMADITVIRSDGALPPHDLQSPFLGLPRAFGTTPLNVPAAPYLLADATLAASWAARLPRDGLRAGLVWAGQARPWLQGFAAVDGRRSAGLAAFAPLASVRGVRFISLQAGTAAAQGQESPESMDLTDPMENVHDFADTAAIITNLDVVVSVDTSVAHLAGAMGKPVFLLDRYDNCWRWLHGRNTSPWYPSMTIFRQSRPGEWNSAMHRAASSLAAMASSRDVKPAAARTSALAA